MLKYLKNIPSSFVHLKLGCIITRNLSTSLLWCLVILIYFLQSASAHGNQFEDDDHNVVLTLDLWENPELIINFSVSNSATIYHIKPSLQSLKLNALISLSLTSMLCGQSETQSESVSIKVIQNYGDLTWSCVNKTEANDSILVGKFLLSDYNSFDLEVHGDWTNSRAVLLATVYRKTDNNCKCDEGFFCCSNACPYFPESLLNNNLTKNVEHTNHRCISQDLVCNGQINCGFACANEDENQDLCSPQTTIQSSSDHPCIENPQLCEPKDKNILNWFLIALGGAAALLFMGFFFFCLWYRRRTDWGIEKDTPYPRHPSVISLDEEGPGGTVISKSRRMNIPESSRAPNPAAMAVMNIQRMSVPNDGVYSFEDV